MTEGPHHIFIKRGDARAEVDGVLRGLQASHPSPEAAGFHKYLFVTQAEQTVVFLASGAAALAAALRSRPGWTEPGDEPLTG